MEGGNGERCVVCGDCGQAFVARDHSVGKRDARHASRGDLARRGIAYIFLRLTGSAYHKHIEQTEPGNDEGPSPQLQRATRTGSQEGKASQSRSSARNCALRRDVRAHRACRLSRIAAGPLPTHLQTLVNSSMVSTMRLTKLYWHFIAPWAHSECLNGVKPSIALRSW